MFDEARIELPMQLTWGGILNPPSFKNAGTRTLSHCSWVIMITISSAVACEA